MTKWEYKVVAVEVYDIGDAIKDKRKRENLDSEISNEDWMRATWKHGRSDMGRVAMSPRGCYTRPQKALNEWGEQGWEAAGVTPGLRSFFGGNSQEWWDTEYAIWLKKPKVAN